MFNAALMSALPAQPNAPHTKLAWLRRFATATWPQPQHRWLVYAGSPATTSALYSSIDRSSLHPAPRIDRFSGALLDVHLIRVSHRNPLASTEPP